jgi:hypothetical protein
LLAPQVRQDSAAGFQPWIHPVCRNLSRIVD